VTAAKYTLGAICPKCDAPASLKGRRILKHSCAVQGYRSLVTCSGSSTKATDADVLAWLKREQESIANARSYTANRVADAERALAEARASQAETEARAEWTAAQLAALGGES